MIDNLLGGDDEGPDESGGDDMDGGLFDADEGDDDLMGGDDMGFDGMDDGGSSSAEMDNRLDELENEVASLSSTVNTVKSENEQISESVGDVEENIRKLLEVYEMVTRGVNPFVDETEMGDAFGGGGGANPNGGSMGLFGDDDDGADTDIDESVADAEADDFFDDDLDDEGFDDGFGDEFDESPGIEDDDGFEGGLDDVDGSGLDDDLGDGFDDDPGKDGTDDGGGKSFEELKAEYDAGDADWDDNDDAEPANEDPAFDDTSAGDDVDAVGSTADLEGVEDETASGPDGELTAETTERSDDGRDTPIDGGKPYLETLPSGYVADIVVMDWLEFLVEEAGVDGAARTIGYYEAIEWVDEEAAETLQTFLKGFGEGVEADPDPGSSLTVAHHNRSLRFISRIANPDMEMVAFDDRGAGAAGGQSPGFGGSAAFSDRNRVDRAVESDGGRDLGDTGPQPERGRRPDRGVDVTRDRHSDGDAGTDRAGFDWGEGRTE